MKNKKKYEVAVAGATGAVGTHMLSILEERKFPVAGLKALASERSVGKKLKFAGGEVTVGQLAKDSFEGVDIALFSAGASRSREFAPHAVKSGAVVVDNSSAFRMEAGVPLVVPEVNPGDIKKHKGIIANPNCSTIQMVVVLKPLHDVSRIKRVVVSTYQATSGAGARAMEELKLQAKAVLEGKEFAPSLFPKQIAFNVIPEIPQSNAFGKSGYSEEEMKMVNETRKIMGDDSILVSATTVRVPVFNCHSESVNIEFEKKISAERVRKLLSAAPGVIVLDEPRKHGYPTPAEVSGKDEVFVGRIREDISNPNGIELWIVGDNLRKGAALNAVQIAECLINAKNTA